MTDKRIWVVEFKPGNDPYRYMAFGDEKKAADFAVGIGDPPVPYVPEEYFDDVSAELHRMEQKEIARQAMPADAAQEALKAARADLLTYGEKHKYTLALIEPLIEDDKALTLNEVRKTYFPDGSMDECVDCGHSRGQHLIFRSGKCHSAWCHCPRFVEKKEVPHG